MEIQGWPFDLNISSSSGGGQTLLSNTTSLPVGDQLLTVQDGNFGVFLAILDELTIDGGNLTTMQKDPVLVGSQLQIFLPSFQRGLFLDPTLAILVQPDEGGDGDDTPLIVGLTVGLAGGLLMIIVMGGLVAVAVAIVSRFWWRRRGISKAVNWEGKPADTL